MKKIVIFLLSCFTVYTQILRVREWESTQARHLWVIFENFENYLEENWEYLEQNWITLLWANLTFSYSYRVLTSLSYVTKNTLQQYKRVVGMHSILYSGQGIPRMLQGEILVFCCTLEAIYLPVWKRLAHRYEMWQMNHLWLTHIYLYSWYIPDLIRLANDTKTNPGSAVADNTDSSKTICAPHSSSNILSSNIEAMANYFRKLYDCWRKSCCVTQARRVWNQNRQQNRMPHLPL